MLQSAILLLTPAAPGIAAGYVLGGRLSGLGASLNGLAILANGQMPYSTAVPCSRCT